MKMTLKKAADLSRSAIEMAGKMTSRNTVTLSVFQKESLAETISKARETMLQTEADARNLLVVGYSMRSMIGKVNAEVGVDAALTNLALLDAMDRRYTAMLKQYEQTFRDAENDDAGVETISNRFEMMRKRFENAANTSMGRYEETVMAPVMDAITFKQESSDLAALRRQKADLKDKIAGLNLSNHIELTDDMVAELKKVGLLA